MRNIAKFISSFLCNFFLTILSEMIVLASGGTEETKPLHRFSIFADSDDQIESNS